MEEKTLVGYHTTDIDSLNSIMQNGFEMSEPMSKHWLGKGVYFFIDLYYAVEWKIIGVLKKYNIEENDEIRNTGIIIADINYKDFEFVDLSTPMGYEIYKEFLEVIRSNYSEDEYTEIIENGTKYVLKVLENLEHIKNEKYLSAFDIVCADYPKDIGEHKNRFGIEGEFILAVQKQICVKNLLVIESINKLNDEENELKLLEIVKRNRRNGNDKQSRNNK